ncbi:ABC transporter ATP-binding protein [Anaerovorax odorimutans]|uniref:ABC transporter ATP-binding protein n=1 Tax=Anaerovorax odorimutans TaxID=109327 RepID=UPI000419474E|nr:ABC transporter ATP-binding protein [Anaerovorax odorimutans]
MIKLLKYYKPYTALILLTLLLLFLQVMADLALPNYMAKIINNGIALGNISYILIKGIQMLIIAFIGGLCAVGVGFFASRIAAKSSMHMREDVFKKVSDFSNAEFDKFSTASLITRSTNDIQQIQMVSVMLLRMVCMAPIMGIGALIMAYKSSPSMSWTIFLALVIVLSIMITFFFITSSRFKKLQKLVDKLNLIMNERLTGMLVIRAFNTQSYEEKRFDKTNKELTSLNLFVNRVMTFMMPMMMLIMNGVSILIVWTGAKMINMGALEVGDMLAFIQYTMMIIMSFMLISMVFIMMPKALVSGQRIAEVLQTQSNIKDPAENKTKYLNKGESELKGYVEFKNVSFHYPDAAEDVIHDLSFTAKPGETTALIGSTGSGKSTVVNLIPRFYDVTQGEILIDGVDIRDMKQNNLRDIIGYVPQKAVLFSGTIESNLLYGDKNASEKELIDASEIAQAMEFISEKPQGFDTEISQGGTNVSGGQKQRLSIARALVKNPKIFIFDDSFSALDYETDALLRNQLKEKKKDSTKIIVTQRISTIKNAEQIIVLDNGKMVGKGKHSELMKNCQVYKEIALSQLDEEELQ